MKRIFLFAVVFAMIFSLVGTALAGANGRRGRSDRGSLEFVPFPGAPNYPPAPSGYEEAGGIVKYNLSGPTLIFSIKAYGLVPGQEYHIRTCTDVVGAGAADEAGNMTVVGSASGSYHGMEPEDFFTIQTLGEKYSIILWTDMHGYDWR